MDYPRVSAIIPVFKGEKYVAHAVESALAQSYKNVEVVIVNDGSPDRSDDKIKPFLRFANVKYIETENRGVAAARNVGICAASGEIVAFLDQDDIWLPHKTEIEVEYLVSYPEVQLVHGRQRYADADGRSMSYERDWVADISGRCFESLFERNRIAILTVAVRKACLTEVGLFDESISKADDYELWMRIARRFPIGFVDEAVGIYRLHDANASRDAFSMELAELGAVDAILRKFPESIGELGRERVQRRLFDLNSGVANWYMWQAQDYTAAKAHYKNALGCRPLHVKTWRRYVWCALSRAQRQACMWYLERARSLLGLATK